MFPDLTVKWKPFPSVIDGITGPWISNQGFCGDDLCLAVIGNPGTTRAYGIKIEPLIHAGYDDLIYHGATWQVESHFYDDGVYIKEAEQSALLSRYADDQFLGEVRHFLFWSNTDCYEVLSREKPEIITFSGLDEAVNWNRQLEWQSAWT